ncbi:hypothetical protein GYMLUDRAFT_49744 [Collybiopsis luxurians FD-317 M1]|uniref:N-acetyltransferase domain-containing protein n=1 Tax=Collybiopsis luxurians FD-317 M1 TaxID=944289 RepID=A0A0D0CCW2_9AGAR|nr:hypothetical protein GYMLUDRAFT_49744 [Collybiopsis luxurians FD-317 M1]
MSFTTRQLSASASEQEIESVVKCLELAFESDQFTLTCIGAHIGADGRFEFDREILQQFHRSLVVAGLLGGEVYLAESPMKEVLGAAIWFGPGRELFDSEDQHDAALVPLFQKFSPELSKWWNENFLPKYKEFTDTSFGEGSKIQSWHLQWIGTAPDHRKKGVATSLVNIVKDKRGDNKMCLETENPINLHWYEQVGFQIYGKTEFVGLHHGTGFPMWAMLSVSKH